MAAGNGGTPGAPVSSCVLSALTPSSGSGRPGGTAPRTPRSSQVASVGPKALGCTARAGEATAPFLGLAALAAAAGAAAEAATGITSGQTYLNLTGFPFPLGPLLTRRTVRTQVDNGIWTFEQEQSLANIAVNVRMTVIRLESGGLWVHNPVAPTDECDALLRELGLPVEYIVLGSAQYEHKIFVGPFSRRWPEAKVFVVPQQWSWPVDLPSAFFGIFATGDLKDRDEETPWAAEIEQRVLCPRDRLGFSYSAAECAFFHRRSKTLICTDALVFVPEEPPAVLDRAELTALGRTSGNFVLDLVALTDWRGSSGLVREAQRAEEAAPPRDEAQLLRIGWQRDALLALYFGPDGQSIIDPARAFGAINGRWIVGPVCYALVYSGKIRQEVCNWADAICEWDIQQILPCHFAGPVRGTRDDVGRAFEVLRGEGAADSPAEAAGFVLPWPFPQPIRYRAEDLQLLTDIRNVLVKLNVI
eukprot:CAMPEP_0179040536 /NCGR_PEP_ID=MMETSP0796-20121207/15696_1 /TAXON_ID=73915 /ORGANISM="Pyrodinium bahamense, Strain pbaha01" /LENGTH=473 /DNA_ID=CAMNT_0020736881 /DNA_START=254 /DNA_END=1674 /DNA_ORIENTATION=+